MKNGNKVHCCNVLKTLRQYLGAATLTPGISSALWQSSSDNEGHAITPVLVRLPEGLDLPYKACNDRQVSLSRQYQALKTVCGLEGFAGQKLENQEC